MDSEADYKRQRALWEKSVAEWSDDDLVWMLSLRFTAEPVPPCRVCGAALTVASMGGGEATKWTCPKAGNDLDHWAGSTFRHLRPGDETVMELIRRYTEAHPTGGNHD